MDWRERNDMVEAALLGERLPGQRGRVRVECPFCVSSKTLRADASLSVDPVTGLYYCHRCTTGGKLHGEQYLLLDDGWKPRCGGVVEIDETAEWRHMPPDCVFLFEGEWVGSYSIEEPVAYVASRGIDAALGVELGVGACLRGRYGGYVVLPFIEEGFGCWGWVARCYNGRPRIGKDGTPRKYLYPFGMPRGDHFDNAKALAEKTDVPFLVVEGKFDAVHHRPNAGASLGHLADGHHRRLQAAERPLVFFGDGDAWEENMMLAAQYRLLGQRAGYIRLPPKTDPDQVPADWALEEAYRCLDRPM